MGKIFCVMGKSATGKDTIYQKLLTENMAILLSAQLWVLLIPKKQLHSEK